MPLGGFPPYLQTDAQGVNYGLTGQLSPEAALQEQALNRRRAIANLLVQQGLAGTPGGKMVGRFYVADSPVQGFANLAKVAGGAFLANRADTKQREVAQEEQKNVNKEIADYEDDQWYRKGLAEIIAKRQMQPPPPAAPAPMPTTPGEQASPSMEPFRGIAPRPDGPYQGQVGAVPMPGVGVQSDKPPVQTLPPSSIAGQPNLQGLDMGNVQPADMSAMATPPAATAKVPAATPPTPQQTPPMPQPVTPAPQSPYEGLTRLLVSQHPAVRRYAELQLAMAQKRDELEAQRGFLSQEKELDREVRREGIAENAAARAATIQNTLAMKEMSLAQMEREGLRDEAARKRHDDLLKSMGEDRNKLAEMQARMASSDRRYQSDALKAIAGEKQALKQEGAFNQDASMLNSTTANLDRLATATNELLNHPGVVGITGLRGKVPDVPGSDAANARALLNTIKSQIAFGVLQEMRNNSKTGGALGNVSDAEGKRLEANLAALDTTQSPEQFKKQLNAVLGYVDSAKDRLHGAFNLKHKGKDAPTIGAPKGIGGASIDTLPPGAKQIGTSGGKPVYQTPDGKKFIGE